MSLPCPPPEGWTLLEAAQALCPEEYEIFAARGDRLAKAIDAAVEEDPRYDPFFPPTRHDWLSNCLSAALSQRADLTIKGINLTLGLQAPRVPVPFDLLQIANMKRRQPSVSLHFLFEENAAVVAHITNNHLIEIDCYAFEEIKLYGVRVEVIRTDVNAGLQVSATPAPLPPFSLEMLEAWYLHRVRDWPPNKTPPTAEEDIRDAVAKYGEKATRARLRAIRANLAPAEWKKQGPRGPRNSRRGAN